MRRLLFSFLVPQLQFIATKLLSLTIRVLPPQYASPTFAAGHFRAIVGVVPFSASIVFSPFLSVAPLNSLLRYVSADWSGVLSGFFELMCLVV